jgi:pilus assembly protein Flp/PilA
MLAKFRSSMLRSPIVRKLIGDTRGATMVEYIVVVGVVALLAIVGFKAFGQKVQQKIQDEGQKVENLQAEQSK